MILTVFGANGRVGTLLVNEALERNHEVRAFVHNTNPFEPAPHLTVLKGDATNAPAVDDAIHGSDAAISTLGTFRRGGQPVMDTALHLITQSMTSHGVRRLVVLTGAGVLDPTIRTPFRTRLNRLILRAMDRSAVPDVDAAMQTLRNSATEHSTLCAPTITSTGPSVYRLINTMPSLGTKVPGPAVAAALLDLVDKPGPSVLGIQAA